MPREQATTGRRTFLKLAGGAAVSVTLAGCSEGNNAQTTADQGGSDGGGGGGGEDGGGGSGGESNSLLTYARGSKTTTLDQQASTNGENTKVTKQIYETLISLEPGTFNITEGLATNWSFEGTTLTFQLREGVTFHNGEELTADDVVATLRRHIDPDYEHYPGTEYVNSAGNQEIGAYLAEDGWSVEGDYTVSFELKNQYAPFLRNWVSYEQVIYSKKAIEETGKDLASEPAGTGPFELADWDTSNQRLRLQAYEDYWGDPPGVDEVLFRVIPENTTRAQALDAGEIDVADGLDPQAMGLIENSGNAKIQGKMGLNTGFLAPNMAAREEFRNKKVRQAMNYAIDTASIVNTVFDGIAVQSSQAIPEVLWGHNEELEPYPYDPDRARQLLAEAGYENGFDLELSVMTDPRPYMPAPEQMGELVRSNLDEVGINTTLNRMPFGSYVSYILEGKHEACFLGHFGTNADPSFFAHTLLHPQIDESKIPEGQDWIPFDTEGYNRYGMNAWANREYMTLVEDAQQTYDQAERESLYREAMALAHDEAPWMFIDHAQYIRAVHNRVSGWVPDGNIAGPYLWLVSVE
jgi:peptide/nickel transport system substrate-binding protein